MAEMILTIVCPPHQVPNEANIRNREKKVFFLAFIRTKYSKYCRVKLSVDAI